MNLNNNPTIDQLRELIRSGADTAAHHVLWVNKSGEVELLQIPRDWPPVGFEKAHPDMQMRVETFLAGNEYVGPEAAADNEWITELFTNLINERPKASRKSRIWITCNWPRTNRFGSRSSSCPLPSPLTFGIRRPTN